MFEISVNLEDFYSAAADMDAFEDQVPFAISKTMNDALFAARRELVEKTWPSAIHERNRSFLTAALRVEKADKHHLEGAIVDVLGRAKLEEHARGGRLTARRGRLAIPPEGSVSRGPHGVRKDQLPAAIITNTPKKSLRLTARGIFVAEGGRLHLKYSLSQSAAQPADVPFYSDFERVIHEAMEANFERELEKAMRSRRPRATD